MTDTAPEPNDYGATDDILDEAKELFKVCEDRESVNRRDALDDIKFARMAEQWPEAIKRQRQLDGRPCLTINRLPSFIRQVVNDARQNKPAIKVHPADSTADAKTAEIYNGLIRNIEVTSKADQAYDTALECAVTSGLGYFRINTKYAFDDTFDVDLCIETVPNPFSVWGDPYSTATDSSDWDCAFVGETIPHETFERKYKGAEPVDWEASYNSLERPWCDEKSVFVVEYWKREEVKRPIVMLSNGETMAADVYAQNKALLDPAGVTVVGQRDVASHKVTQTLMTGAEVLSQQVWPGRYIPIVPVYGDVVNVEGERFLRSLVRDAKDPQMMFNFWRTASTELVALAPRTPFIGAVGAFKTDQQKWAEANNVSHAYIEYDAVSGASPPQRQQFAGPPAGAIQEALNAADDMKAVTGLHDASLGARSNETSGRAILARQKEGDVSNFHFTDNLSRAIEHAGRILIDVIPVVYTPGRMVRVLGVDGTPQSVQLGQVPPDQAQQPSPEEQAVQGIETSRVYDLSIGKYDLTVETGPSYTTRREEAAAEMVEMARLNPAIMQLAGDLLVKNLDWPGADEIAARMKAMLPPQLQGKNPQVEAITQQAKQAVGQAQQHAQAITQQAQQIIDQLKQQNQQLQQQLASKGADIAVKTDANKVDAYKAETDRMEAQAKIDKGKLEMLGQVGFMPGAFDPSQGQVNGVPEGQF